MDTLESLLQKIKVKLADARVYYLSNDPERALGLEKLLPNYSIVHIDNNEYLDDFNIGNINYFCLAKETSLMEDFFRSSVKLINSEQFLKYYQSTRGQQNYFQTFKISPAFELAVSKLGGMILNTKAELNRLYEDKITQYQLLSKLSINLPKTTIGVINEFHYDELCREYGKEFVIQFARGHTGSSTIFIENKEQFEEIKTQFGQRMVKISELIKGVAYTINCCNTKYGVLFGGLSKQITGNIKLTPLAGGTVGNDWADHKDFIKGKDKLCSEIKVIGEQMLANGYYGLFGLDIIVDKNGNHFFIEINARQPASIPMYTKMQLKNNEIPLSLIHIAEFLGIEYSIDIDIYNNIAIQPYNFAQVFIRAFEDISIKSQFPCGIYRLQGDNAGYDPIKEERINNAIFLDEQKDKSLLKQRDAYSIDQLEGKEGILILTQSKDRLIKKNDELARIQINQNAILVNDEIKPWIIEILQAVYNYQK